MAIIIKSTGLDQYAPGGLARLRMLLVGGPGVGKTRYSTYWPKPFIASCEAGLASVADRRVNFAEVKNSQDMAEVLAMMRDECKKPDASRRWQTLVIDTLDAYQRKVKDEWLQANPAAQAFRGFDAWGYLDTKMQMVLTRLLNLDMNVIVNVHYKDKTIKEGSGDSAVERQELMLQLSGDSKDSVFNDFDLVGWMGTYWDAENVDGESKRVEKRGLTFIRTEQKPFLKDRLHITPPWMPIKFDDEDYHQLFAALIARFDDLEETEVVGEVPSLSDRAEIAASAGVVTPSGAGGALPPQAERALPLEAMDKVQLQQKAREINKEIAEANVGVGPIEFKGNTIKSELLGLIKDKQSEFALAKEKAQAAASGAAAAPAAAAAEPVAPEPTPEPTAPAEPVAEPAVEPSVETPAVQAAAAAEPDINAPMALDESIGAPSTTVEPAPAETISTPQGVIDTRTGEITPHPEVTHEQAVANVQESLGGTVVSEQPTVDAAPVVPASVPAPAPVAPPIVTPPAQPAPSPGLRMGRSDVCVKANCGKTLANEPNQDFVRISYVRFRHDLCNEHFSESREAGHYVA